MIEDRQGYYVVDNDDHYQSVFPEKDSELSQLHSSAEDAIEYIHEVAGDVCIKTT